MLVNVDGNRNNGVSCVSRQGRKEVGEDFNDIISHEDKQGGKMTGESSFSPFRTFIREMEMGEIIFQERRWTWANNRSGKGLIEERLDMFFGSAEWFVSFDKSEVMHLLS